MNINKSSEEIISSFFIIIPTIYTLFGLYFFTYPLQQTIINLLPIPIFVGLSLLLIGSFYDKKIIASKLRMLGWIIFSGYWATQPQTLYWSEQQDLINSILCIMGIYVLFYFAYREWYSNKIKKYDPSLQWIAGASALAGLIYFIFELTPLAPYLINSIAIQSGWLLNIFTGEVTINPPYLYYKMANIKIIFACTAVQSMVIFIGMILPLPNVENKRKIKGLLITVVPVYFLNLIRNAGITYLVGIYGASFFSIAHNYIGKGGSLIALIILLLIVTRVVPEVFDNIIQLTDLPKNKGPIEKQISKIFGRSKIK